MLQLIFLLLPYSLFLLSWVDAIRNDQKHASSLLHSVDMLSRSIAHPLRDRFERIGPLVEHAEMQHIFKSFLPTMHRLEVLERPARLSIQPYEIDCMPISSSTIHSVKAVGKRTIKVEFYQQFYLRLPPWQAGNYMGSVYRVILKGSVDFEELERRIQRRRVKTLFPSVPLLSAPFPPFSPSPEVIHLPIAKSYHPRGWNRNRYGYSHIFTFLALCLQQDKTIESPKQKLYIFLKAASKLLPGLDLDVLSKKQTKSTKGSQIAVNLMQRIDTDDDLLISAAPQTSYRPHTGKSMIVLARTIGTGIDDTLAMLVLRLPNLWHPVHRFTPDQKRCLALMQEALVVHANRNEIDAMVSREGNQLFTQQYFQEFYIYK